MGKIRVVVAEDSVTVRKHLVEVLQSDPGFEVVGEAENGKAAIGLCQALKPDVLTIDLIMPEMSGLAATEHLMAHQPLPILVVSASTNRGELFQTYDALAAGAVDVLEKPRSEEKTAEWDARFISAVRVVSRIRVIRRTRPGAPVMPLPVQPVRSAAISLVAIGTSTGGPGAIVSILRGLPGDYPLPILLVMHIAAPFAQALGDWLDAQSAHRVRYASDGEALDGLGPGVTMAPADVHLEVKGRQLKLTHGPERFSCRPSVDVLFESLAKELGPQVAAFLLTGMGRDGAQGLLEIRRAGGHTVAQDEASSAVYGMPREAVGLGAAVRVLSLPEMPGELVRLAAGRSR
ncbi:MAG: chemotaxis-specific protein-glutamate methyltransferase CheB [Myxococcaceae bacterium]|nr:chemotaxis-specific protein-glutamate methyltransferase CheB [Myxococcaceae bacterium]